MSNLFEKIGSVIVSIGLTIGGFFGYTPEPEVAYVPETVYVPQEEESLGADTVLPIAGVTYYLAGTGISSSATSFTLTSFTITQNGKKITDSEMSETFYFTLEPGSRARQEIIACTTVAQNADGTATISGCSRGMSPVTPYTASSSLQFAHAGGSIAIISNPPQLYNQVAIKGNDETITGYWDFPTPVAGTNPTTKDYVLSVVTGGTITSDSIIVSGVAGETFATGTVVYLATADQRWYKADADLESTFSNKQLGIAQGVGDAGVSVVNGILTYGIDRTQVGLTPGGIVWLSRTTGATTTSSTTQALGVAQDTDEMFFDTNILKSNFYSTTTFSGTTTFDGLVLGIGSSTVKTYSASTSQQTYTKPSMGLRYIILRMVGGGGGGGAGDDTTTDSLGGGGGAGGYCELLISAAALSSTVQLFVGTGGSGESNTGAEAEDSTSGASSWFGSFATSTGGTYARGTGYGGGGSTTGCNLSLSGAPGFPGGTVDRESYPGFGGASIWGNSYGGGGSGGNSCDNSCGNGSSGNSGFMVIHEYF